MRAAIYTKTAKIANTESSVKIGVEGPNITVESTYMTNVSYTIQSGIILWYSNHAQLLIK